MDGEQLPIYVNTIEYPYQPFYFEPVVTGFVSGARIRR